MDKPESEVNIRVAKCGKCKNVVFVTVEHMMDKNSQKELSNCVKAGCDVETISLLEFKKLKIKKWCNTECDKKKK
jgi:hypothetical protein